MKKFYKVLITACMMILFMAVFNVCFADGPQPPGPPGGHGLTENQGPFDAFVGDGVAILYVLAIEYALYYFFRDKIARLFVRKSHQQ
ncbi:MAG: hypothetical protein NTU98_13610 [Bacteroidetes bacterium]|nr:hypothetical protein [Bacteroidota bacterium]